MSILIKGMDMPKNCINCMFTTIDCDMCILTKNDLMLCGGRPSWCPLVPLPEKHGRLGDLDALQEEFKKSKGGKRLMLIDTAPTIVPAEGGTDKCSEN